jgi:hypothetical protein
LLVELLQQGELTQIVAATVNPAEVTAEAWDDGQPGDHRCDPRGGRDPGGVADGLDERPWRGPQVMAALEREAADGVSLEQVLREDERAVEAVLRIDVLEQCPAFFVIRRRQDGGRRPTVLIDDHGYKPMFRAPDATCGHYDTSGR